MPLHTARTISRIFDPLWAFVLGISAVGIYNGQAINGIALVIFLSVGGGGPLLGWMYEYLKRKQDTIDVGRYRREYIYLFGVFSFCFCCLIFGSSILTSSWWFYMSMIFAMFFALYYSINLIFDKASLHTGAYTLFVMLIAGQINTVLLLLLALLPIVIWARVILHKHTWVQILWGLAIGLATGLLTWMI